MTNPRKALLIGIVGATLFASIAGYVIVSQNTPAAARARLLVDAGLLAAVVFIVLSATSDTARRTAELVEGLRALARGAKDQRLNVDDFGGLSEVARAVNEVAASLC